MCPHCKYWKLAYVKIHFVIKTHFWLQLPVEVQKCFVWILWLNFVRSTKYCVLHTLRLPNAYSLAEIWTCPAHFIRPAAVATLFGGPGLDLIIKHLTRVTLAQHRSRPRRDPLPYHLKPGYLAMPVICTLRFCCLFQQAFQRIIHACCANVDLYCSDLNSFKVENSWIFLPCTHPISDFLMDSL